MSSIDAFLNFFDIISIAVLVYLNISNWHRKNSKFSIYLVSIIILGLLCPFLSFMIEWELNPADEEVFDAFTMFYSLFKFPIYWFLLIIQLIVLNKPLAKRIFTYQKE